MITVLYSGLCGVFLCWCLIDLGYLKHSGVVVKSADFSQHFSFLIWKVSNNQWKNCLKQCLVPLEMLIIIIIKKLKVRQINRDTRIIWRNFEQVGCNSDAEKLYGGWKGSRPDLWASRTTLFSKVNPKILNQPFSYICIWRIIITLHSNTVANNGIITVKSRLTGKLIELKLQPLSLEWTPSKALYWILFSYIFSSFLKRAASHQMCFVSGKESTCQCRRCGFDPIPGLERFPGGGNGNPLQYSCLENSLNRGAW